MTTTPEQCFKRDIIVLDLFKVMHLMEERYAADPTKPGLSIHDTLLVDLWPDWYDNRSNGSYWKLYRDWIPTETGKTFWDLMCLELGIEQDLPAYPSGFKPSLEIVFWVSW